MVFKVRKNITYRLHQQRDRLTPSIDLRRRYLAKMSADQVRSEKDMIASHLGKMQPGVRRVFLASRLEHLNQHEKRKEE